MFPFWNKVPELVTSLACVKLPACFPCLQQGFLDSIEQQVGFLPCICQVPHMLLFLKKESELDVSSFLHAPLSSAGVAD